MYFGLAFSRVGLDFRVLLVPIFEDAILEQFKTSINMANSKFEDSLVKLNWSDLNVESIKSISKLNAEIQATLTSGNYNNSIINPPIQLLEFQPLAIYLNFVLQSFNELRLCAPISLFKKFSNQIKSSIRNLGSFIFDYYKKEKLTFDKNENDLFINFFLFEFVYTLIPFLEKCIFILFPIEQLQKLYGVSQNDIEKLKHSLKLDSNEILEAIKDLIPPPPNIEDIKPIDINLEFANQKLGVEEATNIEIAKEIEGEPSLSNEEKNISKVVIEDQHDQPEQERKENTLVENIVSEST